MTNFDTIALLGQRFRTYRKALHISQQQLHEKTGVSLFTISSFENGKGQGLSLSHLLSHSLTAWPSDVLCTPQDLK